MRQHSDIYIFHSKFPFLFGQPDQENFSFLSIRTSREARLWTFNGKLFSAFLRMCWFAVWVNCTLSRLSCRRSSSSLKVLHCERTQDEDNFPELFSPPFSSSRARDDDVRAFTPTTAIIIHSTLIHYAKSSPFNEWRMAISLLLFTFNHNLLNHRKQRQIIERRRGHTHTHTSANFISLKLLTNCSRGASTTRSQAEEEVGNVWISPQKENFPSTQFHRYE